MGKCVPQVAQHRQPKDTKVFCHIVTNNWRLSGHINNYDCSDCYDGMHYTVGPRVQNSKASSGNSTVHFDRFGDDSFPCVLPSFVYQNKKVKIQNTYSRPDETRHEEATVHDTDLFDILNTPCTVYFAHE